ncbi:MAG: type II CRISPR-associated endonuclease Cas1 [Cyclobacteriaceae bacterium]
MSKRIINIENPYHLSLKHKQLLLRDKENDDREHSIPVEDMACLVLEHPNTSITLKILQELAEHNVSVIICNYQHLPASMFFHLDTHYVQQERFQHQIEATEPLKKRIWQQTIKAKIWNQALLLEKAGKDGLALKNIARKVSSGDSDNRESKAARVYWSRIFDFPFNREREGIWPNPLLNYGYSLVRAMVARSLAASGLLPLIGIHHHNRYNAYCLADDIMEPYRPFVDQVVLQAINTFPDVQDINREIKQLMLGVLLVDTLYEMQLSPIQSSILKTTQTLANSFMEGKCMIKYAQLV